MSGAAVAGDDGAHPTNEISGVYLADHCGVYAGEAEAAELGLRMKLTGSQR